MVYFIGDGIEKSDVLEDLREKLMENSRLLLSLFKERLELGKSIGQVKRARKLDLRDRTRELQVLKRLNVRDPIEERFINILFELTIMSECTGKHVKHDASVTGTEALQEMLAEFLCLPGDRILTDVNIELPFIQRAVSKGVHVVNEGREPYDLRIQISRQTQDSSIRIWNLSFKDPASLSDEFHRSRIIKLEVDE